MKHILVAALLFVVTSVSAQQPKEQSSNANPLSAALRQMEQRAAKNLTGAADEMPAEKYSFRPTPEQMTFAHLMKHVAEANDNFCSAVGGQPLPDSKVSEDDSKEKLVAAVRESFTYCDQALAKVDDSNLGQSVTLFGQDATRGAAMLRLAASWADHYGAAAMYLRLNHLLPPSASKNDHK